jgi:hypothetical protein
MMERRFAFGKVMPRRQLEVERHSSSVDFLLTVYRLFCFAISVQVTENQC